VSAIEVCGLRKRFGEVDALDAIDFEVREGEIFGFLGPDGAGKTTTINVLTGLARADSGTVRIADIVTTWRPRAAQHLFGVVPDESNLYPELTGFANLSFCGALYGMRRREREARARELLETFGLTDAGGRSFEGYSRGRKRKLAIAAAIIHRPAILFLDEPTTGIDVVSTRGIRDLVRQLNASGTTVFLTTHNIEEAERLCDRVAFIFSGRVVRVGEVGELMSEAAGRNAVEFALDRLPASLAPQASAAFPGLECEPVSRTLLRVSSLGPVKIGPLVRWLEEQGFEVGEARRARPSVEDVFVRITGIVAGAMGESPERRESGA